MITDQKSVTGKECLHSVVDVSFTKHSGLLCKTSIVKRDRRSLFLKNDTFLQLPKEDYLLIRMFFVKRPRIIHSDLDYKDRTLTPQISPDSEDGQNREQGVFWFYNLCLKHSRPNYICMPSVSDLEQGHFV